MNLQTLSDAITANTAATDDLTASIDLAITKLGDPTNQAEIDAAVDAIKANNDSLTAAKTKLDAAVNPTTPTP